jgi:hypothetical protein
MILSDERSNSGAVVGAGISGRAENTLEVFSSGESLASIALISSPDVPLKT